MLFVGDLSDGDLSVVKEIQKLSLPTAVILGNHDRGKDPSGSVLKRQLSLLGDLHCGWSLRQWHEPSLAVVGARPCSAGGGFFLSPAVQAIYGPLTSQQSAQRIVDAVKLAPQDWPLVILAHSGPMGLGSEASSPCGRDWKKPAVDWGDHDLALALEQVRRERNPELVVFGHMHHELKRGLGYRKTFIQDSSGTAFLNAACVPRRGLDESGQSLVHFAWAEFMGCHLTHLSQRWYSSNGTLEYQETLLQC